MPTSGAPLSPCLPPGRSDELGHGVEGRVQAGGLLFPRAGLGRWGSGRMAWEHCAGRDRGCSGLLLGQLRWFLRGRAPVPGSGLTDSRHAIARTWAGAAGQPGPLPADRAEQKPSGFDSLLHPPLEGRRMPGISQRPALLCQGPWEPHGKGVPRPGRGSPGLAATPHRPPGEPGLSCPWVTLASAGSVLEEGRGPTAEQHDAAHQGGGRASYPAGQECPGSRRWPLHRHCGQRGGGDLLQCHPQRAAR